MSKKIIRREIENELLQLSKEYPVVTITGPRQSGKTTLVKTAFPEKPYYNLENPDIRALIQNDPRAFFSNHPNGAILDEIHKIPDLLSYIQGIVDESGKRGMFILTGSNQLNLMSDVSQSLAGRTTILKLLPFTFSETLKFNKSYSTDHWIFNGFYPGVYSEKIRPTTAQRSYFETYIERDVKQLANIMDFSAFQRFITLTAGRIGHVFNATALSNEVGVSYKTIQHWMSVLEASFVVFLLRPYYQNLSKRVIKSPKIYFYDVGMACFLLGIYDQKQLFRDPLRGNLFENMIIANLLKNYYNRGLMPRLYFYRDKGGLEVDLIIEDARRLSLAEIKSSETFHPVFTKALKKAGKIFGDKIQGSFVLYDGDIEQSSGDIRILNYRNFNPFGI